MSLIESAIQKAKKLGDTQTLRALVTGAPAETTTEPKRESRRTPKVDAAAVAARAAVARSLPVASVDEQLMESNRVVLKVSDIGAQQAYRILRTRVQQRMLARDWRTLAITAAGAGEGKTLTAINLALSLVRDLNTWVYLVDLDLQRPRVAQYLGMRFEKGLNDYLSNRAGFDDIIYSPGVERLAIIPNAEIMEHSSDVLGSPRMHELCETLANEQTRPIVIYDLPPLLMSDDVIKFAPNFDCALLVASEGVTSRAGLEKAQEILREMNFLGVVLNRSSERLESSYYY